MALQRAISRAGSWLRFLGLAICLAGLSSEPAAAQSAPPARSPTGAGALDLDVVTYNVQFVAPWNFTRAARKHRPNTEARARAIGRALACFDIAGLNETINDDRRRQILEAMEMAAPACGKAARFAGGRHFEIFAGPKLPKGENRLANFKTIAAYANGDLPLAAVDDEIALVTRLPIVARDMMVFGSARGADALAAKGVLYARLRREAPVPAEIDVFVTHLQANHADIRERQVVELLRFIDAKSDPGLPALILGDFNIDGGPRGRLRLGTEYQNLMQGLSALGFVDPGLRLGGTDSWRRRRIDHIFLRPGTEPFDPGSEALRPLALRVDGMRGPDDVALSDHAAVVGRFLWRDTGASILPVRGIGGFQAPAGPTPVGVPLISGP